MTTRMMAVPPRSQQGRETGSQKLPPSVLTCVDLDVAAADDVAVGSGDFGDVGAPDPGPSWDEKAGAWKRGSGGRAAADAAAAGRAMTADGAGRSLTRKAGAVHPCRPAAAVAVVGKMLIET